MRRDDLDSILLDQQPAFVPLPAVCPLCQKPCLQAELAACRGRCEACDQSGSPYVRVAALRAVREPTRAKRYKKRVGKDVSVPKLTPELWK